MLKTLQKYLVKAKDKGLHIESGLETSSIF